MKIKSLNLISYSKFKSKEIILSDGVNVIYGNNESGKSSIMAFIKAMLYGLSGKGNTLSNDRKKYSPWDGTPITGKMYLETDDGQNLIVSRTAGKTPAQDKVLVLSADTGEETFFSAEKELGIGEEAFLKTLYIRQLSGIINGEDDEISSKLINLTQSGEEDTSFYKAMDILSADIKYYKHQKGDGGRINELKKQVLMLNAEIEEAEKTNNRLFSELCTQKKINIELEDTKARLLEIKTQIEIAKEQIALNKYNEELTKRDEILENIEKANKEENYLQNERERLKAFNEEADEIIYTPAENTDALKIQMENCMHKTASSKTLSIVLYVLSILAVLGCFFFMPIVLIAVILAFVGTLALNASKKADLQYNDIKQKIDEAEIIEKQKINELLKFGCASIKDYSDKKAEYKTLLEKIYLVRKTVTEKSIALQMANELVLKAESKIKNFEAMQYVSYNLDDLEKEQTELLCKQNNLTKEEGEIKGHLDANFSGKRFADEIYAEKEEVLEELKNAEKEYLALMLAQKALTEAFNDLSKNYTPRLNNKASNILSQITDGIHNKIIVDKKYSVTMENDLKQLGFFSNGTIDQVYFSIRLAIIDMLFGDKNPPLFLDDVFVQYDDDRCSRALKLLLKMGEKKQIIIFSCRPLNINSDTVNIINL